jgi:ABC-2 type transport system permease protein
MTTATAVPAPPSAVVPPDARPGALAVAGASLRAEWVKLRTVRSTTWSLLVTVALTVGLGALFCAARVARWDRLDLREQLTFDRTGFSLNGVFLAQLAIGVLGVLVVTSEYATGQIRASLGAVPQRGVVLASKIAVFVVVTFIVGTVASFGAFFAGQAILAQKHASATLGDPGALRAVIGGGLYLAALGALGLGLGAILRRTAGAIATLVGLLLILPILVSFLPSPWSEDLRKWLPAPAGQSIFHTRTDLADLSPWVGFAVLCGWAAGALLIGAIVLQRRDA